MAIFWTEWLQVSQSPDSAVFLNAILGQHPVF